MSKDRDSLVGGVGCAIFLLWLGWLGLVAWAIVELVTWITSK